MKLLKSTPIFFAVIFVFTLCSCRSTSYDYEEVEEEYVEIPVSKTDNAGVDSKNQDVSYSESSQKETVLKESVSKESSGAVSYTVQIGAFTNEQNATEYFNKAKSKLPYDITMKNINGLYKLRIGNFANRDEAYKMLDKIRELGFDDSFMVKIIKRLNEQ